MFLRVADDRDVRRDVLGDLRRVDVDVDELGPRGELGQLAGDAVVEAGADGHDQVGLVHRVVGRARAVHAEHAQPLLVRRRERAEAHQRAGDRQPVADARARSAPPTAFALIDAAAHVEDRAGARWPAPWRRGGSAWSCRRWSAGSRAGGRRRPARTSISARVRSCGMSISTGPGPAGAGDVERLVDRPRDLRRVLDHEASA